MYQAFLGPYEEFKTFFHGHTYTGNPLGAAVGLASLDIFAQDRIIEGLPVKIELLARRLAAMAEASPRGGYPPARPDGGPRTGGG